MEPTKTVIVYYRQKYIGKAQTFENIDQARDFIEVLENEIGGYAFRVVTPDRVMFRELIRDIPTVKWIEEMNGKYEYRETI